MALRMIVQTCDPILDISRMSFWTEQSVEEFALDTVRHTERLTGHEHPADTVVTLNTGEVDGKVVYFMVIHFTDRPIQYDTFVEVNV